jgi:hypothetical protein
MLKVRCSLNSGHSSGKVVSRGWVFLFKKAEVYAYELGPPVRLLVAPEI